MEPIQFLDGLSGYARNSTSNSADKPIRLAVIDPAYNPQASPYPESTPLAKVTFEGESILSGKAYPVAAGYVPYPGARVWMVPIGTTYLIAGAATHYTSQGFYASPNGIDYGVEFGDGNYFDSEAGLFLQTDAEIAGDLTVGGIGAVRRAFRTTNLGKVTTTLANDPVLSGLHLDIGWWFIDMPLAVSGSTGDLKTQWAFTGTWVGERTCWGPSDAVEAQPSNNAPGRWGLMQFNQDATYGLNSTVTWTGIREWATVQVTAPGELSLQWAQQTTDSANASSVNRGSLIRAERIA